MHVHGATVLNLAACVCISGFVAMDVHAHVVDSGAWERLHVWGAGGMQSMKLAPRPRTTCGVHFFVPGVRKGGTTSLIHWISTHRDVLGVNLENMTDALRDATVNTTATISLRHNTPASPSGRARWHPGETNAFAGRNYASTRKLVNEWFGTPPGNAVRAGKLAGDASVGTLTSKQQLEHIKRMCGTDVRFIVLLRCVWRRGCNLQQQSCCNCC